MKTILRTACAILGTFAVIASVHADTFITGTALPVINTSSDLSSVSLRISGKTYTGEEVKNRIISNIFAIESTKKTTNEKTAFIDSMLSKVKKIQWRYIETPKGENKKGILKVLYSVYSILLNESVSLNSQRTIDIFIDNEMKQIPLSSCLLQHLRDGTANNVSNVDAGLKQSLSKATTSSECYYVYILYETSRSAPSTGWRDKETAINYMIQRYSSDYKIAPKFIKTMIIRAVDDFYAWDTTFNPFQHLSERFQILEETLENN